MVEDRNKVMEEDHNKQDRNKEDRNKVTEEDRNKVTEVDRNKEDHNKVTEEDRNQVTTTISGTTVKCSSIKNNSSSRRRKITGIRSARDFAVTNATNVSSSWPWYLP